MRKFLVMAAGMFMCLSASAQFYYQDSKNVDMLRHAKPADAARREIVIPGVNGFNVYKADLHIHSVYSDGDVTPEYRVREAWNDGLDVIAMTDHVEYRRQEDKLISYLKGYIPEGTKAINNRIIDKPADERGIQVDLNIPVKLAQAAAHAYGIVVIPGAEVTRTPETIGHYNALFTKDNNTIYATDPFVSIQNAKAQGALVMHNHPGWRREDMKILEFEQKVYDAGLIDGIEIMNGGEFYPHAVERALQYGFFMSGNTDIHQSTYEVYGMNGEFRDFTMIFAKDNSLESLREALEAHRTLAYAFGTIAGEEQLLKDFFMASVSARVVYENAKGAKTVALTNNTSLPFLIQFPDSNPIILRPFSTYRTSIGKQKALTFTVDNMWCGKDAHPQIEFVF